MLVRLIILPQVSFPAPSPPPWDSDCRRNPPGHQHWGWPPFLSPEILTFPALILVNATERGRFYWRATDLPLWAASPHSTWNWVDHWWLAWSVTIMRFRSLYLKLDKEYIPLPNAPFPQNVKWNGNFVKVNSKLWLLVPDPLQFTKTRAKSFY